MSKNPNRTIADIVAEKRARANKIESAAGGMPNQFQRELIADLRAEADELEAAAKREREAVTNSHAIGNAAALREALRTLRQRFDNNAMAYQDRYLRFSGWHWHKKAADAKRWRDVFSELREACDAALAAPPRNCDFPLVVGGPANNNADKAWLIFKHRNPDAYFDVPGLLRCIEWLLAPATKVKFEEAIEHLKHGALIRRKGDPLWCWLGKSGMCYYGLRRDCPLQFRDSWLNSDVFADDWEIKEGSVK